MSFLNPSVLFALSAISIPILIHLLNLRKIKKVEFSTLMFLKEIQKSKMRRIKLKQLLLLLFRILVIIFLVLSFSKPVFEGYAGNDALSVKSTLLIFVDDSFSMNARDNNGLYLTKAADCVKRILDVHKQSKEIYFVPFSKIGLKNYVSLKNNSEEAEQEIKNLSISFKYTSVNSVLNYAEKVCAGSMNELNEIYIISDFQKSNFSNPESGNNNYEIIKDNNTKLCLVNIGSREVSNLSVDSFKVKTDLLEKDKEIKVKINLNNFSGFNVLNKTVNLVVENELTGSKSADAEAYGKNELEFAFKTGKAGNISGYFELVQNVFSEDELTQDNKFYFTIYIPEKYKITLIGENRSALNYPEMAINSANDLLSDSIKKQSNMFILSREKEVTENIFKSDAVFISDKAGFTDAEGEILKKYVSDGGGVFIFPGKEADVKSYNNLLSGKLNSLRLEGLNSDQEENLNLRFGKINFEHPVLSGVFKNQSLNITTQKLNIESPVINSYYNLLLSGNASPLISLNNDRTFIAESKLSKGKIIVSSVSSGNDFSDLPLKNIFLPLIIRSILYFKNNSPDQKENVIGIDNLISVRGLDDIASVTLPDKENKKIYPAGSFFDNFDNFDNKESILYLPYSDITSVPGEYKLQDSAGKSFIFPLNYNSNESNAMKMTGPEITGYFERSGIKNAIYIENPDEVTKIITESRTGLSLWKYMLFGAILFLMAELLLSRYLDNN